MLGKHIEIQYKWLSNVVKSKSKGTNALDLRDQKCHDFCRRCLVYHKSNGSFPSLGLFVFFLMGFHLYYGFQSLGPEQYSPLKPKSGPIEYDSRFVYIMFNSVSLTGLSAWTWTIVRLTSFFQKINQARDPNC